MGNRSTDFAAATGAGYELQMGRFSKLLAPKFLDFAGVLGNGQVLDAGCGTGALTRGICDRVSSGHVTAIDISSEYVEYATRKLVDPRVTFEVADVTRLPYPDAYFDQVYSQLALDFVPDTARAFCEIKRVLKPGGTFSAAVWDARGGLVFNRLFLDTAAILDGDAGLLRRKNFTRPLRRPGDLMKAALSAGFLDVHHSELVIRTDFTSFEDYWSPFDGVDGPIPAYLAKRPPELKAKIKEAVRDAFLDGEDDGPRSYVAVAWAISAVR